MGEGLYESLVREQGYHTRIYAPVGGHRDLLAYLVRRLLENGANSSFVHQLADESLTDADLIADPVAKIAAVGGTRHPSIPLPDGSVRARAREQPRASTSTTGPSWSGSPRRWRRRSISRRTTSAAGRRAGRPARSRASRTGRSAASRSAPQCLERLADLLERDRDMLMRIAVQEAKKTIPDALAEVREAVDFCRYYAAQARKHLQPVELPGPTGERNVLRMEGRGAWVCIAPWNFPLAIFLGQVSAALAAGNSVVAKPASQTPEIAAYAVGLAHDAGIPEDALILAAGRRDMGQKLMEDVRIAGVAFTGSTATAKTHRPHPDRRRRSRHHPADRRDRRDQRDDRRFDRSARAGGAGRRSPRPSARPASAARRCACWCCRRTSPSGRWRCWRGRWTRSIVGDPADPRTDVGPVIDQPSYDKLMGRREAMKDRIAEDRPGAGGGPVRAADPDPRSTRSRICSEEWFGPLLHVTTWKGGELAETVRRVNASGFGLTMGLHSRIARAAETVEETGTVGNLYVNRSMIGAIVGSQPFGGEGQSGTGPKAGGPHYLPRFCAERVTSTDTTSSGGNATLLSLEDVGF